MEYRHKPTGKIATPSHTEDGTEYYKIRGELSVLPEWVLQCACEWEKVVDYNTITLTVKEVLDLYRSLFGDVALVRAFPKKVIELAKTKVK